MISLESYEMPAFGPNGRGETHDQGAGTNETQEQGEDEQNERTGGSK